MRRAMGKRKKRAGAVSRIAFALTVAGAPLLLNETAEAQSARQMREMTALGCVIRSEAGQRYWACPPAAMRQVRRSRDPETTGSVAPRGPAATGRGEINYCVRQCDGFYFPLGAPANGSSGALQQACDTVCPGAATTPYSVRANSDGISEARSVADGSLYRDFQNAFLHQRRLIVGCSCRTEDGDASARVKQDPTLKAGDIVVTAEGPQVYQGNSSFVDLRDSDALNPALRRALTERIELSQR